LLFTINSSSELLDLYNCEEGKARQSNPQQRFFLQKVSEIQALPCLWIALSLKLLAMTVRASYSQLFLVAFICFNKHFRTL
jgi:hypothetical protein